jgi:hypothetical protein
MADESSAATGAVNIASNTLSQLLARILDQLSLSAWLPSAALTLLVGFVFELGASLTPVVSPRPGRSNTRLGFPEALSHTFATMGRASIGGLILLTIIIVVLTMLTQAFSFEAIRVMEGYWGTNRLVERFAAWKCKRHRRRFDRYTTRRAAVRQAAWDNVAERLSRAQPATASRGRRPAYHPKVIIAIGDRVMGTVSGVRVSAAQRETASRYEWESDAPADDLRRQLNLDMKLDDYPEDDQHIMPTHLGNVLRKFEDDTNQERVESFIEKVYESLPFSMQLSHDEQRARLDLYCSMVFVLALTAFVAVLRFGGLHWTYSAAAVSVCGAGAWVAYRAAIASARYYGSLLVGISEYVSKRDASSLESAAAA